MFSNLTLAVERGDYASFALESDEQLRHDITPTAFQTLHEQLRPRMERGFETRYLGCLEQRGCKMFLWVVTFRDGGDQLIGKLSTKNSKATEFSLQ